MQRGPGPVSSVDGAAGAAGLALGRPGLPARSAGLPVARLAGPVAMAGLAAASAALAAGAAHRSSVFVPAAAQRDPLWLTGPLAGLGVPRTAPGGAWLLVAMLACYLVALACADSIPARWGLMAIVTAHVVLLLGPPLFSADVLSYLAYARLGVLHGLNPYVHVPFDAAGDPVSAFVRWRHVPTPYGPAFTLATYPLALLPFPVAFWVLKGAAAAASLGCVALVWRIARQRGRDPWRAALFVGANPVVLAHAVGGAHNDVLLMVVVLLAVTWSLSGRDARSGAGIALATLGVKVSAGLVAPFMLLGARDRRSFLWGAVVAAGGILAASLIAFGTGSRGVVGQVGFQQRLVSVYSVPSDIVHVLGLTAVPFWLRATMGSLLVLTVAVGLVRTWRGADWITAAGWSMLAALASTAWLTPWYALWALPLAAVSPSRPLRAAAVLFTTYLIARRAIPILVFGLHGPLT